MPVSITIRDVPDDVREGLAARAAISGRSMQEYLVAELAALARRPSAFEAALRARTRARAYPPIDIADVLADRDADRR